MAATWTFPKSPTSSCFDGPSTCVDTPFEDRGLKHPKALLDAGLVGGSPGPPCSRGFFGINSVGSPLRGRRVSSAPTSNLTSEPGCITSRACFLEHLAFSSVRLLPEEGLLSSRWQRASVRHFPFCWPGLFSIPKEFHPSCCKERLLSIEVFLLPPLHYRGHWARAKSPT
jgi:hypothetical protein